MSERYTVEVFGGCLGDWIPDGTVLIADPEAELRPLDMCQIIIRAGDGPWARFIRAAGDDVGGACKIFMGWIERPEGRLALVGQIAPPVVGLIPGAEIESIHKVIGAGGQALRMTENDLASLALIAPWRVAA